MGKRAEFFKTAGVLWVGGVVGAVAVLPYAFALQSEQIAIAVEQTGLGVVALGAMSAAQSAVIFAGAVLAGLWAARRLGIRMPLVRQIARAPEDEPAPRFALVSIAVGVGGALLVIGLDALVFVPRMPPELAELAGSTPVADQVWRGALASLYGGISEELLLRLGLLCLIAIGLRRIAGRDRRGLGPGVFWVANVLAAVIFGVGHLPATAALVSLTPLIVVRGVVLNAIVGLGCGWLMWRRCLEAAILAHFSADIVLHVILPIICNQ